MLKSLAGERIAVSIGQHSEAGCKPANQDFHGALMPEGSTLALKGIAICIADGISTSSVSHLAAETAIKSFLTDYYCTSDAWSVKTSGSRVIAATNSWLYAQTRRSNLHEDMNRGFVCTFSALVLKGRAAHIFHLGDTRIQRLSGAGLEQLTTDHRTRLSSSESYLARAMGLAPDVEIEYRAVEIRPGDVFVLTTDGVHEHVSGAEISTLISGSDDLDAAARKIVAAALENGSQDNATVQIIQVDQLPGRDVTCFLNGVDILPPALPPRVPSELDGYRVVRQLHGSSRSHIFVAVDLGTGEKVALKVPSLDLRDNADYLRRFAMEEWIARRLDSPHVLKAAPADRERDTLYVVTELIEGQSLRQWIADNPEPSLDSVRDIVDQIAKGLRAFHRKEMLHQDLRPENVMIDRSGTVKIIDFGAVRVTGVLEASPVLASDDILGTHQYAAPEYFLGEAGSNRSDLYSLGVMAYEMLTGRLPYGARMARATSRLRQARVKYVPVATYRHDLPMWIDDALRRAVHFDPVKRQEALSEFIQDLKQPRNVGVGARTVPLLERDPVLFWKAVALALATTTIGLLIFR
ncbi:MAG: bifunctional protein-serine/threonine kinase/phosphatase [Hyphomicrobiaceae bacterium]